MSYPVRYCPYCEREISEPTLQRATEKEKEIGQPFHESWKGINWTKSSDSTTIDTDDYEIVYY